MLKAITLGAAILLADNTTTTYANQKHILFSRKTITILPNTVTAVGTLTGKGIAYPVNTYRIICYKRDMSCLWVSLDEIGENQVSSISFPTEYAIKRWTDDEIQAGDDNPGSTNCSHDTFIIKLKSKTLEWFSESANTWTEACKSLYNGSSWSYRWTLEDPPEWQK